MDFSAFPVHPAFDIYVCMPPAGAAGGGFCDSFMPDGDRLALVMADLYGRGVDAAAFMPQVRDLLRERAHAGGSPAEILAAVNERVCVLDGADVSAAVWLGILELPSGSFAAAEAGRAAPALCRADGTFEILKSGRGPALGAAPGARYRDAALEMRPGDKLFLYTRGVPAAADAGRRAFGTARMLAALDEGRSLSPRGVLETVWARVNAFTGDAPQDNDLTMLCFELKEVKPDMQVLKVPARVDRLEEVTAFVDGFLEAQDCSFKAQTQIELAVEEIFVNVASYAYPDGEGDVEIGISAADGEVTLTFSDAGVPYDPLQKEDPDITLSAEQRNIGGLGIFLVKKNMDTVRYRYENGRNVLTLTKKLK